MTDRISSRTLLAVLAMLAVVAGLLVVGYGTPSGTAQSGEPTLDCVGSGGGAAYVATDTGMTIYENDTGITYGQPRSDYITFDLGGITFSSEGAATARMESGSGSTTCLGDVDATTAPLEVSPDGQNDVVLAGTYAGLAFRDPVADPDDAGTDLVYDASAPDAVTVRDVDLANGTTVMLRNTDGGETIETTTVDGGSATFDDLPTGRQALDLAAGGDQGQILVEIERAPTSVTEGDWIALETIVENTGASRATVTPELQFDGERVEWRQISLGAGAAERLALAARTNGQDRPNVTAAVVTPHDRAAVDVTVEPTAGDIIVGDLWPRETNVSPGEPLSITGMVAQAGGQGSDGTVTASLAGEQRANETVTLGLGDSTRIPFELSTEGLPPGQYEYAVAVDDSRKTGRLTVGDGEPPAQPDGDVDVQDEIPANATWFDVVTSNFTAIDAENGGTLVVENLDAGDEFVVDSVGEGTLTVDVDDLPIAGGDAIRVRLFEDENRSTLLATDESTVATRPAGPSLAVRDFEIANRTDEQAEDVEITVAETAGSAAENVSLSLTVVAPDGSTVYDATTDVGTIAAGAERPVTVGAAGTPPFGPFASTPDPYEATVSVEADDTEGTAATDQFSVIATAEEGTIDVTDLALSENAVQAGTPVEATIDVANPGDRSASESIDLVVNGTTVETWSLSLSPGGQGALSATVTTDDMAGDVSVLARSAGDEASTTLSVAPADDDGGDEGEDEGGDGGDGDDNDGDAGSSPGGPGDQPDGDESTGPPDEPSDPEPASFAVELDGLAQHVDVGEELVVPYTVQNVGGRTGTQTVRLVADGEEVASRSYTLDAGDVVTGEISLTLDADAMPNIEIAAVGPTDRDDATVLVNGEPRPAIDAVAVPEQVEADERVTADVDVRNDGSLAFDGIVRLSVGGATAERSIELDAGETTTVTVETAAPAGGEHDWRVTAGDASDEGTLTVLSGLGYGHEVDRSEETVAVHVTVENPDPIEATEEVTVTIGDESVSRTITVPAGERVTERFSVDADDLDAGEQPYQVRAGGEPVLSGSVTVPETGDGGDGGPPLLLVAAIVLVVAALLGAGAYRWRE